MCTIMTFATARGVLEESYRSPPITAPVSADLQKYKYDPNEDLKTLLIVSPPSLQVALKCMNIFLCICPVEIGVRGEKRWVVHVIDR